MVRAQHKASAWMLASLPTAAMPDSVWLRVAWMMSVDEETYAGTQILSTSDGIWRIRCQTSHAGACLSRHEAEIIARLRGMSAVRILPRVMAFEVIWGAMTSVLASAQKEEKVPLDETGIPETIDEPSLRQYLASVRPKQKDS